MAVDLTLEGFDGVEAVGWGGFAFVCRARQLRFDREVAVKVLNVRPGSDVSEALRRECTAIGSLSGHPNIVTVHDVGETADGRPFIVMEYLHGGSLGDLVRADGPLGWREAADMAVQLAGALETAHRAGILHRDVKPENVLVSRFRSPKLGDFGVARLHGDSPGAKVIGSLRHAAPEVLADSPATVTSDVYSLGSTLFTMLAGRPPFGWGSAEGTVDLRNRIAHDPVPDLRPNGVPDALCRIVEQALAKRPADRQPSAEELGRQLQGVLDGPTSPSAPLRIYGPERRRRLHGRVLTATVAAVAVVTGVVAILSGGSTSIDSASPSPSTAPSAPPTTTTVTTTPSPQPGSFSDDFSGPDARWGDFPSAGGPYIQHYLDGAYRMALDWDALPKPPPNVPVTAINVSPFYSFAPLSDPPSHLVRVTTDATKVTTERGDFGVACGGPLSQFPYVGLVDSGGWWRLYNNQEGIADRQLRNGRNPAAVEGPGPHRIMIECRGDGEVVTIALTVNGIQLAIAQGARGSLFGPGPGLALGPVASSIDVIFDNVEIDYS